MMLKYTLIYILFLGLITYKFIKSKIKDLKLLINFPNSQKNSLYKFVEEFLDLRGIDKDDIIILNQETIYKSMYISTSYTHDLDSNKPPRKEVYEFYKEIVKAVNCMNLNI